MLVKPSFTSRGIGVHWINAPKEEYTPGKKVQAKVIQKYIERTFLLRLPGPTGRLENRKFDIRQWVLVTSFCPLTIWFYNECYVRFGATEYHIEDINNRYMHLTNNSVTKYCGDKGNIEENMWEQSDLEKYMMVIRV